MQGKHLWTEKPRRQATNHPSFQPLLPRAIWYNCSAMTARATMRHPRIDSGISQSAQSTQPALLQDVLGLQGVPGEAILDLLAEARAFRLQPEQFQDVGHGKSVGLLFFEDSTRTRCSARMAGAASISLWLRDGEYFVLRCGFLVAAFLKERRPNAFFTQFPTPSPSTR